MQVQSLRVFRDLAEVKNFTKTAQKHGVGQPAVSQIVRSMERQLQAPLMVRASSCPESHLTPEGKLFYAFAKRTLRTLDSLQTKIEEVGNQVAANLRLTSVQSIGLYDLPPLVNRLRRERPGVTVQVEYRLRDEIYEDILQNRTDLGLVPFPVYQPDVSTIRFRNDRLMVACHPRHPLARRKVIKPKDLRGMKIVGLRPGVSTRRLEPRWVKLDYVFQLEDLEAVKQAVEIDMGVAVLPEGILRDEVANGSLAAVPLEGRHSIPLALIHRKAKFLTPAMKRFIELVREPK